MICGEKPLFEERKIKIEIDKKKCVGCGICVKYCPEGAIFIVNGKAFIDKSLCKECLICVEECPFRAVRRVK